jgi:hypothetical protein
MNSSRLFLGTLLVVVLSTTYIFVSTAALGPRFKIANDSLATIVVTAKWRDKVRSLGSIEPDSSTSLTVRDEASMVFEIQFEDGREMTSEPVYFTSGSTTHISVSDAGVSIEHDAGS